MKKLFSLLFLTTLVTGIFANDEFNCLIIDSAGIVREHTVDFQKLVLNVKFDTKEAKVIGFANYKFKPLRPELDELFLDGPNIDIVSITLNGQKVDYESVESGINLKFPNTLTWDRDYHLLIKYIAQPQKGIYFIGWNDITERSREQIWTQGQGIDNRHWVPSYDGVNDKLITETVITFETGYEVISNGELLSKTKNKNNTTTWHYAMDKPHALYLMMIAIGKYEYRDYESDSGITSRQYYYPDRKDAEETTYKHSIKMMNWFEEEIGIPYPWKIYRNVPVQDFMYGAMENTTATIFTDYYLQNEKEALERNYVGTNAHELAHQWFGDYITEWSGSSHWLHESFATHYSKQFLREVHGEDDYKWHARNEQNSALRASKKNDLPIGHSGSGSSRHYPKGSYVLDMLRYVVGEKEYKKTVTDYLNNHALGMVDTHDFEMAFMKSLGMNLGWFFNQWIYKGGEPEYEISYKAGMAKTVVSVKQIQVQNDLVGLFKMPIKFQVHYRDGSMVEVAEWIQKESETVVIPNTSLKKVDYILFDPNSNILKKVKFDRPYKTLLVQAQKAKNLMDRYDAVEAMKDMEVDKKREDLIELYLEEEHQALKQSILLQLKDDDHPKTEQLYVYALGDKNVKVRRTAIDNLKIKSKRYIKFYEEMLHDESYVNAEKALIVLCKEYPVMTKEYLYRTRHLGNENVSFKLTWLKLTFGKQKVLYSEIADYATESFDFRTRIKAMKILGEIGYSENTYLYSLVDAYVSFNRRLVGPAQKQLKVLLKETETGTILGSYVSNHTWKNFEEEKLDKLLIEFNRKIYK
jgi:aminopeptidase N